MGIFVHFENSYIRYSTPWAPTNPGAEAWVSSREVAELSHEVQALSQKTQDLIKQIDDLTDLVRDYARRTHPSQSKRQSRSDHQGSER